MLGVTVLAVMAGGGLFFLAEPADLGAGHVWFKVVPPPPGGFVPISAILLRDVRDYVSRESSAGELRGSSGDSTPRVAINPGATDRGRRGR